LATVSLKVRRLIMILAMAVVLLAMSAAPAMAQNVHVNVSGNKICVICNSNVEIQNVSIGPINVTV
jgi:hypothetical protein